MRATSTLLAVLIGGTALAVFGWDLRAEPHFMDESAYVSQAFYGDLVLDGQRDHPAWLDYAGYDLPPLPKYLIGWELRLEGVRRLTWADARSWYQNPGRRLVGPDMLVAARRPMVALGSLGCVAIFGVGTRLANQRVGVLAAFLLLANPLYRLHARRAMSDIPAESFMLLALFLGVVAWQGGTTGRPTLRAWLAALGAGLMVGLATLSKLNGVLAGLTLGAWVVLGLVVPGSGGRSRGFLVGSTLLAGLVAFGVFVALNPFLTAQPPGSARLPSFAQRVAIVYHHRADVSVQAEQQFPRDALPTLLSRAAVVAVQGFGRFGPLGPAGMRDSTIRFDPRQDWSTLVWLPTVLAGLVVAIGRGWGLVRAGAAPLPWLAALSFGVALVVVTGFIPLAWDRYLLSVQAPATLLGAMALVAAWDRVRLGRRVAPSMPQGGATP